MRYIVSLFRVHHDKDGTVRPTCLRSGLCGRVHVDVVVRAEAERDPLGVGCQLLRRGVPIASLDLFDERGCARAIGRTPTTTTNDRPENATFKIAHQAGGRGGGRKERTNRLMMEQKNKNTDKNKTGQKKERKKARA